MLKNLFIALLCSSAALVDAAPLPDEDFVTACSQNLGRFGDKTRRQNDEQRAKQLSYLLGRMRNAKCDVVAVQEVIGDTKSEAANLLQGIAAALSSRTGRSFISIVGDGRDKFIRNGYLIDQNIFEVKEVVSYDELTLPRYRTLAPPGYFDRAPFAVLLEPKKLPAGSKQIYLINNHFKSKAFSHKDAAGLEFELIRMQQAEAVREIVDSKLTKSQSEAVVVLLGGRNSGVDSASSAVIEGEYLLKDFLSATCIVEKNGHPKCTKQGSEARTMHGLFEYRQQQFPGKYRGGSYRYRGIEEYLDEIFIRSNELERVIDSKRRVRIGTEGDYFKGSDHKLVWAEIEVNSW